MKKKLEKLFSKWEEVAKQNGDTQFCPDGLMNKGEVRYLENGVWEAQSGDEERMWLEAPKKVLFLFNDYNAGTNEDEAADIRCFTLRKNGSGADAIQIDHGFCEVVACWLYGLLHVNGGKARNFDSIDNADLCNFLDKTPYAWMNCKKEGGAGQVSESVMNAYTKKYRDYIKEELLILDADIIVCGGTFSYVEDIFREIYGERTKGTEHSLWYYKEHNKVILTPNHPSARASTKVKYSDLMEVFEQFLAKYPEFIK